MSFMRVYKLMVLRQMLHIPSCIFDALSVKLGLDTSLGASEKNY